MNKIFFTAVFLFVILALPSIAMAAGLIDIEITGITGCYGHAFGSVCETNEKQLFTSIACKVMSTIDAAVIPIYCNITQNPAYIDFLNALLVLYVTIYGFSFLAGLTNNSLGEVVFGLIKMGLVYAILSSSGLFFTLIYQSVLETPQELVKDILSVHGSGSQSVFEYVDEGMYKVFDEMLQPQLNPEDRQTYVAKELTIMAIILGVKSLIPGGNVIYGLFIFVVMGWLMSYLMVVIRYLYAYLALTFMLMLAPIFIPSTLFKKTSFLFDEWFKYIVVFVTEIVLVVAFVIMIEPFYTQFYDMLKQSFNGLNLEKQDTYYLKSYNTGTTQEYVKEETVDGIKDPVPTLNQAGFQGDATNISSEVIVNLVTMGLIIFLSSAFLRLVPDLAKAVAGKYNFSGITGGERFAQTSSANRANLHGQTGYKGKVESSNSDADNPNGVWSGFSSLLGI